MCTISEALNTMKASNYFDAWENVLLSDYAEEEWKQILHNSSDPLLYDLIAKKLHENSVPYVIVSEYLDEFFRYYKQESAKHDIKNNIAEAYLRKKLLDDKKLIDIELKKKLSVSIESKQELINAHMKWMKNFICTVTGEPQFFELDYTKCFVGKWLIEERENISAELYQRHKNLHSMAQSALRMYKKNDYAYFLLLYTDILSSSYQIRDSIMNIYFSRRIRSVFEDPISGQANYFQLKVDLQNLEQKQTILLFNIKEFSKINLLYGHENGDRVIKEILDIVSKIKNVVRTYRIYGDEFAAIFAKEHKEFVLEEIKTALHQHEFNIHQNKILLSFYGSVADITEHVLEHCEYGLMISKHHYGEIVAVDDIPENVFREYANEITLSQQLRLAFLDNRVLTYFQPILDLKTNKIFKYEVLMRIEDINSNILEPKSFLEVLKGMYIYPEVTKLIIKNSFEFFKNNVYDFSINLSFADIINDDTKAFITAIIKEYPEVAKRCTFELLEHEAILNEVEVSDFFSTLHNSGIKIALDDFGVGYANYDTIFKFDIDYIKIDGSLTESILTSSRSRVLVESIVTVARNLNAKIVVEFVSSKEILDCVRNLEIDYAQGYYIGKPKSELV